PEQTAEVVEKIFSPTQGGELRLLLAGSPFQIQVWRALLRVPEGVSCSYSDLAKAIHKPKASRAVGTAVGANPLALLIPCHRVIRNDTGLGGYRWGLARKLALQAWEMGQRGETAA
ncbi:MAG: methylated-DNA--[protein]-cysteine S-methyltransferase, partial [Granulosicoccaceae bacterium]